MKQFFSRANRQAKRRVHRFRRNTSGATAVEFALISLPFFTILFGIIELAVVFFISSTANHATSEAGRLVRVGRFQGCGAQAEFKAIVCSKMAGLGNCSNNLRIDVLTDANFSTLTFEEVPEPEEADEDTGDVPPVANGVYQDTNGGDNVVVRTVYNYRLALPEFMTRLGNPKGSGVRQMMSMTAFRNEPFDTGTTCDPEVQALIDAGS
jgi:Flp pilus assembly protein TadG